VNRDPEDRGQPDGAPTDDQFEAIVAGWRREGAVPAWPGSSPDDDPTDDQAAATRDAPADHTGDGPAADTADIADAERPDPVPPTPGPPTPGPPVPGPPVAGPSAPVPPADEEHFVPPEPPPLPPLGPPAMVGLGLLGIGLTLLIAPGWLGVSEPYGLPLGLVAIAAGLGWLVLRLWPDPPPSDDDPRSDDGAVL
jgi:hypothetical protein